MLDHGYDFFLNCYQVTLSQIFFVIPTYSTSFSNTLLLEYVGIIEKIFDWGKCYFIAIQEKACKLALNDSYLKIYEFYIFLICLKVTIQGSHKLDPMQENFFLE